MAVASRQTSTTTAKNSGDDQHGDRDTRGGARGAAAARVLRVAHAPRGGAGASERVGELVAVIRDGTGA
jgi:hypothetical protein